jgi:hypothetical protein
MWWAIDTERKFLETLPALGGQGIATSQASRPARTFDASAALSATELRCGDGGIARGVSGGHAAGGRDGRDELSQLHKTIADDDDRVWAPFTVLRVMQGASRNAIVCDDGACRSLDL